MRKCVLILIMIASAGYPTQAQELTSSQITGLITQLCQPPTAIGWIQQGQIKATHRTVDDITGETTESTETIVTNGTHFSWKIDIDSHIKGNNQNAAQAEEFMQSNQSRQYAWDGQTYTMYFKSGNQAIVYDASSSVPIRITGALTAGYIPWGRGYFALDALSSAQLSAEQVESGNGNLVHLTIQDPEHPEIRLILDPAKNYAPLSYTIDKDHSRTVHTYGNYVLRSGRYIPMNILSEKYVNEQLRSTETWNWVTADGELSQTELFNAVFEDNTLIEYHTSALDEPLYYRHSAQKDIKPLLDKRIQSGIRQGVQKQNCGTLAIEQILNQYSVSVQDAELSSLVDDASGSTSLYQIQQFFQNKGIHCTSAKINLETLTQLEGCQILIHFPQKKHFVILDRVDDNKAWIIDMSRATFYHSMDISEFKREWAGIALLVSNQPIPLQKNSRPIPDNVLRNIQGAGTTYSCTLRLQYSGVEACQPMILMLCMGRYEVWYDRFGCKQDPLGGECHSVPTVSRVYSYCIEDADYPGECNITGDFIVRYMRACEP